MSFQGLMANFFLFLNNIPLSGCLKIVMMLENNSKACSSLALSLAKVAVYQCGRLYCHRYRITATEMRKSLAALIGWPKQHVQKNDSRHIGFQAPEVHVRVLHLTECCKTAVHLRGLWVPAPESKAGTRWFLEF